MQNSPIGIRTQHSRYQSHSASSLPPQNFGRKTPWLRLPRGSNISLKSAPHAIVPPRISIQGSDTDWRLWLGMTKRAAGILGKQANAKKYRKMCVLQERQFSLPRWIVIISLVRRSIDEWTGPASPAIPECPNIQPHVQIHKWVKFSDSRIIQYRAEVHHATHTPVESTNCPQSNFQPSS